MIPPTTRRHPAQHRSRRVAGALTAAVGLATLLIGVSSGSVAGVVDTQQVALHNDDAATGNECPDGVDDYWHFVIAPNDGTFRFVSITLDLDGDPVSFTGGALIPNGGQADNIFVQVPDGYRLDSIVRARSFADIAPPTGSPKFVLSHLCDGAAAPTTTTATSSTTSTTTTTQPCGSNPQLPPDHPDCVPPTTTTTTTSSTTTSSTQPCEWSPQLADDDPACRPSATVGAICHDIDTSRTIERYWHRLINDEATDLEVSWADGAATLPGNGSILVASAFPTITLAVGGEAVATTPAAAGEHCQQTVTVTKVVDGPGSDGTVYTIQISRLVGADYVAEGDPYQLRAGETIEVPLPSTFNPEGVDYRIEEVDPGDAHANSVTPDSFVLNGHRNETISVVVENSFAAISLDKTVSATVVAPGDPLVYRLIAENTGALTLDRVTIYDRLPPEVVYDHFVIAGGAGTCTLEEAIRPQLVRCDLAGAIATGELTPIIELTVTVAADLTAGSTILNQAMSIGTYDGGLATDGPQATGGASGEQTSTDLSCDPVPGEVCDLAAKVGVQVVVPTTSSTIVGQGGPTTTATATTLVASQGPTTTLTQRLPRTGSDSGGTLVALGAALVLLGGVMLLGTRRPLA